MKLIIQLVQNIRNKYNWIKQLYSMPYEVIPEESSGFRGSDYEEFSEI
jgi:hypothetical protein